MAFGFWLERLAAEAAATGMQYRRRVREPVVIQESDCAPFSRGFIWDVRDPMRCKLADTADVEQGHLNCQYLRERCGEQYERATGSKFQDNELLHALQYGVRLKSDYPFCAVLCPPHASTYEHFGVIAEGIEEERKAK